MTKVPPDFTQLFFDSLGGSPAPLRYPLRQGPCLLHDVAYLSSLLHDARIRNPHVEVIDENLVVQLNRDCWELGLVRKADSSELYVADCELNCHGVQSVSWQFRSSPSGEPWLSHVWLTDGYRTESPIHFLLKGEEWQCDIQLDSDDWSIELKDKETPYLWSARNTG